jgi:HEAT repeat protein
MDKNKISDTDLQSMIADYMENGFLENIIDMFRHDSSLYSLVGFLIQDERVRVRIGTTALIEELSKIDGAAISAALPDILPLLDNGNPVVRGDVTNLLGIIGDKTAIPFLEKILHDDENQNVRSFAKEAIEEIITRNA